MKRRLWWLVRHGNSGRGAAWCRDCERILDRTYFGRLRGHAGGCDRADIFVAMGPRRWNPDPRTQL